MPSAHSAILVSSLYFVYREVGTAPLFVFCAITAIILMYNLVADREREEIRKKIFNFKNPASGAASIEKRVLDISGHTFFDIATGVLFGFLATVVLEKILY
mgnify:FL=1